MAQAADETAPVVIVGAGPTGVVAATLLAQHGVECLLIDRYLEPYPQPRAVHLDDEVFRILGRLGVGEAFAALSRPMLGLRLVDVAGEVLAEFPRPPELARHGYPQASLFDQPELEALLRANLAAHPEVRVELGTEVVDLTPNEDAVHVEVLDRVGRRRSISAGFVLGCDGANSFVRAATGVRLRELGFAQRWLVVDLDADALGGTDLSTWDGVTQVSDARRPATFMRIGRRRYRCEFRLAESESAADYVEMSGLVPLLGPWAAGLDVDALRLVRVSEYTFRAAVADRWRSGRVLLLGDAAHLMPPFTGQGLGGGLRDAHNLAWKVAGVLAGRMPESVLVSYQSEREPHVRSLIRLAIIIGRAMTAGGRFGDILRRAVAPQLHRLPGLRTRAADSTTPRLRRSPLVVPSLPAPRLAGSLCPNVPVAGTTRFDAIAAGRFVLVTMKRLSDAQRIEVEARGAVVVPAEPGSELRGWLSRHRVRAALVRPDLTVLRAGLRPEPLLAELRAVTRTTREDPLLARSF